VDRRRQLRRVRHVQVRFHRRGDPQPQTGSSLDISTTGMFIITNNPLPPGERIRVEVLGENGFVVEAVVARALRVATHLQAIKKPGMGVRFLTVEELVADLVTRGAGPRGEKSGGAAGATVQEDGVYPVRFRDRDHLLQTFRRDISTGGLFVSTRDPARLNEVVTVELHIPESDREPLRLKARVVQRFEPTSSGSSLMAGMGVELVDRLAAIALLEPVVRELDSTS
jgi:Tfp pilus assembly protein PilZ